ncbi:hypothetical protein KVV02_003051 [Mortierella alpina]|uniref:Glutathione S-transferase n=1 Tax=Mortierella alpina TaxID=64518 RepID=A0A9P8CXP0_MORAP|nr:hypothetical protein KVV02_003051 [Mortierella alpina]
MTGVIKDRDQSQDQGQNKQTQLNFSLRTIGISHYNEKARWALDYYRIPYVEHRSMPVLHMISMFKYRASSRPSPTNTRFVTPYLSAVPDSSAAGDLANEVKLNDSTAIAEFLSDQYAAPPKSKQSDSSSSSSCPPPNLYSNDAATKAKILALEERFGKMIGPHVRIYVYNEVLLHSPKSVGKAMGQHDNVGRLQAWIWTVFFGLLSWLLVKSLHISDKSAARSKEILRREFEHISRVLESGPPGPAYLVGNQFTAADLTLASLGGAAVGIGREDGYGAWVPQLTNARPEAQAFCEELRQTTAGKHILECYKLHRGEKAAGSSYGFSFFGLW